MIPISLVPGLAFNSHVFAPVRARVQTMASKGQHLVRRLEKVLQSWPSDPSRKGRDLGEYLKRNYPVKFREELKQNVREVTSSAEFVRMRIKTC